jgi:hypothetical protein
MHPSGRIPPSPNKLINLLLRSENPGFRIKGLTSAWGSCASSKCPKRVIGRCYFPSSSWISKGAPRTASNLSAAEKERMCICVDVCERSP